QQTTNNKQTTTTMLKFEMPKDSSSIIKVIGVGGGGSNAVNYMFKQQIKGVDFIICNTDNQSLQISPVPTKIQLGLSLTQGLGAGAIPEVGRNAAIENIEEIKTLLGNNTRMVFITAGMGGGTGTGAAPVIAQVAKEMGILTVGIVTLPFQFEGKKRRVQADDGIEIMRKSVDTLLVINNDKLREMYGNLTLASAFSNADEVLNTAARGIAEMISVTGLINVDFNDVNTVLKDSGVAIMGSASAEGDNRARVAVEKALASPLLNDNNITGAKFVLLNITYGTQEVTMDEISEITDFIQEEAGSSADVIWGHGFDETLGDKVAVTVIATGFNRSPETGVIAKMPEKKVLHLNDEKPVMITQPISSPTQMSSALESKSFTEEAKAEEPYLKSAETTPVAEEKKEEIIQSAIEFLNKQEITEPTLVTKEEPVEEKPVIVVNESSWELKEEKTEELQEEPVAEWKQPEIIAEEPKKEIVTELPKAEPVAELPKQEIISEQPKVEPVAEEKKIIRHWLVLDEEETKAETKSENPLSNSINQVKSEMQQSKPELSEIKEQTTLFSNANNSVSEDNSDKKLTLDEQQKLANERLQRIKELSMKLKTPTGLNDLENQPAYIRRNIELNDAKHSSESSVSKFSVNEETDENGNKNSGLKSNNSFLHDNVD
ncbi:MAG: cell division protein FtsZ, partial [Bacteroidota bacterium]